MHFVTVGVQHLRNQQAQLAVAQHRDFRCAGKGHLVENLASGGERLDEYRALERDRIRQHVKVALGQSEELGMCARMAYDAEHCALRTVAAEAFAAPVAAAAGEIDLAHHAPPDQSAVAGFDHFAREFVARRS
jgi:hypothetical protein